jgi:acyl-phosphate glycerol 3-phosphate acyltransferase
LAAAFGGDVSKLFGLADPRSFGSGNPGATNVLRTGNKAAAALTLLGDASKGWLAMFVVAKLGAGGTALAGSAANMGTAVAFAGLAAFLGHVFPVFLKFKGGKGVATPWRAIGLTAGSPSARRWSGWPRPSSRVTPRSPRSPLPVWPRHWRCRGMASARFPSSSA